MSKIRVMDSHLANMIAAGEVVERPSGIVKELVENSLDAGATHVEIRVIEGGMQEIAVLDNGEGMDAEDLKQAFKRHSTSKVSEASDLNKIHTFGFRGEALPSIASVSIIEAISHTGGVGNKIIINNGEVIEFSRAPRNQGTTITVKELFSKVPARLKYIKNVRYEYSIILDIVQKFAMANPHISFVLYSDDKEAFRTYGTGKLEDVYLQIFGATLAQDSKSFVGSTFDFKISGMYSLPQHNRANRHSIWVYLNNRMVRIPKVQNSVIDAFHRYLPQGRYPIVVINIGVDPQLVDVNVHPSKWEVRISKEEMLIQCILSTIENALNESTVTAKVTFKQEYVEQKDFKEALIHGVQEESQNPKVFPLETSNFFVPEVKETDDPQEMVHIQEVIKDSYVEVPTMHEDAHRIEPLTVLSQMSGRYILAQGDKGLYIIDQHAAMERIRYEYYQEKLLHDGYPTQPLLIPLLIEGRHRLVARLKEVQNVFSALQIEIDAFDDSTFIVRETPLWIKNENMNQFVEEVLDLIDAEKRVDVEKLRRLSIATLACHSSVRFNEFLTHEEMVSLVEDLRACDQPFHCPHGRPTLILMEHKNLEKEFKR